MAFGLPVEGEDGPFAAEHVEDVATCRPDDDAAEVVARLRDEGGHHAVVVNEERVVLGLIDVHALDEETDGKAVHEVMRLSPSTIRPSVAMSSLAEGDQGAALVTSSDGRLMGVVHPLTEDAEDGDDEDGDDEDGDSGRHAEIERVFLETVEAIQEHFGDHEPSDDEVRAFLRERMIEEGKSPEEADRLLAGSDSAEGAES